LKIILANTYENASSIRPAATVEAEYGERVIRGGVYTLAHHADGYKDQPAPCLFPNQIGFDGDILISHIDLDTIGGCLALYGKKPEDTEFWEAVAFIDVNGPHHVRELPAKGREKLRAYWGYNNSLIKIKHCGICDVTDEILQSGLVIQKIIDGAPFLLQQGEQWELETQVAVERCLVYENDYIRAFVTAGVFCNSAYYSPSLNKIIPAVVSLNTKMNAVLISFSDGGKRFSAASAVKKLWGELAGGHEGIAGSPRGWGLNEAEIRGEFDRAAAYVISLYERDSAVD